jgi:CCDC81-like HU domain protein/sporulation related protein
MRIAKYIGDLLYEYECVVIPGLGGFISNEVSASINANQHSFLPPSKKIVFNPHLLINDGLLVNHIASSENISYLDSKLRVEKFVKKCKFALDHKKRIHFHKIGHLLKNTQDKIEFDPDNNQNYFADSFGLSSFVSPPIKRDVPLRINKKFADRKKKQAQVAPEVQKQTPRHVKPKEHRYVSVNLFSIFVLAILTLGFYFSFSSVKKLYNQYASTIPFFYNSPNEFLILNMDDWPVNKFANTETTEKAPEEASNDYTYLTDDNDFGTDNSDAETTEEFSDEYFSGEENQVIEEEIIIEEPASVAPTQTKKPKNQDDGQALKYFIIAGSFEDRENAMQLVNDLIGKGYRSHIIGQNKFGMFRVCFEGFSDRAMAEEKNAIIRRDENPDAWIFIK